MSNKTSIIWISTVGIIGILFGVFYSIFGLSGFPAYKELIPTDTITTWSNGLYGSTFIGFNVLLFLIGRHSFQQNDVKLMKYLLYGIYAWLVVEAFYSIYYSVFFNVGVDILLALLLGFPFIKSIQLSKE